MLKHAAFVHEIQNVLVKSNREDVIEYFKDRIKEISEKHRVT